MSSIVTIELLPDEVVDVKSVTEFVPGNMVRLYCESGACKVYTTASTPTSLAGYRVLTAHSEYTTDATSSGCWVVGIGDGAVLAADIVTVTSSGGTGAGDASAANQQLEISQLSALNTAVGTKADAVATSDTGSFSLVSLIKKVSQSLSSVVTALTGTLKVDGSATTQPISAAALPLPAGAATQTTLSTMRTDTQSIVYDLGVVTDTTAATSDTGPFTIIQLIKRGLQNWTTLLTRVPIAVNGRMPVDGSGVTQPVSIASNVPVTGPLTDVQLRAQAVDVKGELTFDPLAVMTVTGPLTNDELRATPVAVAGPLTDEQLRAEPVEVVVTGSVFHPDMATAANQKTEIIALQSLVAASGDKADAAATTDVGTFSIIALIKRGLQNWTTLLGRMPALVGGAIPVAVSTTELPTGAATSALQTTGNTTLATTGANIGKQADPAATSDTGTFTLFAFIKRGMQNWTSLLAKLPALSNGKIPVEMNATTVGAVAPTTATIVGGVARVHGQLVDDGDAVQMQMNRFGIATVLPYALPNDTFHLCTIMDNQQMSGTLTASPPAGIRPYITDICLCTTLMEGTNIFITDSFSGHIWMWYLEAGENVNQHFNVPIRGSDQGVLTLSIDNSNASLYAIFTGFYGP